MSIKIIEFEREKDLKEKFLNFPKSLYSKNEITQNRSEEEQVLDGTHILSKYFKVHKFIVTDEKENTIARFIITLYENDENAYVGFFECEKNIKTGTEILNYVINFCREKGYKKVVGPYNSSFWIGYRCKVDRFTSPYFGEPYNKDYYEEIFKLAGFESLKHYTSNSFRKVLKGDINKKHLARFNQMKEKGYVFKTPDSNNIDIVIKDIGKMILDIYSDFPGFKPITVEEFYMLYKDLPKILNYDMVKLAYKDDELKGFLISIPNYGNNIARKNLLKILWTKLFTKEYILMYLGIDKDSPGLGSALAENVQEELMKNGARSIGALIKDETADKIYFKELMDGHFNYELYYKNI